MGVLTTTGNRHICAPRDGGLEVSAPGVTYAGMTEAYANMFPASADTAATLDAIRALHATYPPEKPRAAVFILAYPQWPWGVRRLLARR